MNKRSTVVLVSLMAFIAACGLSLAGCKDDIQDVSIVANKAPAPGNVAVTKESGDVIIKFDAVDDATGYYLYVKKQGNKLFNQLSTSSMTEADGRITVTISSPSSYGITSGKYEIGVQTSGLITGGNMGAPSDPVWVTLDY
ncbi:MAG: hypothetical protein LBC88_06405 [Spirochaetaceae bacterium]|jgi:hypothetical protein|nr:hypothetical protein [Spirochaetaceae bacterium]